MAYLKVHNNKIDKAKAKVLVDICPFRAIQLVEGSVDDIEITAACKMCKICVQRGPAGAVELVEEDSNVQTVDKSLWGGIAVYIEHREGEIHPVSIELLGKALSLAVVGKQEVYALLMGTNLKPLAEELQHYGIDGIYCYEDPSLESFSILPYTRQFEDFIDQVKPSSILVGATNLGRSLAPRIAARYRTGLTADCTMLEIKENTDLVQIRPAFGGNIMAQIITTNHRPQFATVRYKVFDEAKRLGEKSGEIIPMEIQAEKRKSKTEVLAITKKLEEVDLAEANTIVAVGRGLKSIQDIKMVEELAELLDARIACTRPMVEAGHFDPRLQIGLSGRTVKPKLIITLGISGAVQFKAGMQNAETIIAINNDPNAAIFDICHYGFVGDMYEIVPELIRSIREGGTSHA